MGSLDELRSRRPTVSPALDRCSPRLRALVERAIAHGAALDREAATALLAGSGIELEDVLPFVEESAQAYTRRRIARTDRFELLVMTWRTGQGSAPHDHAGSLCALKILSGGVHETRFVPAIDGLVDALPSDEIREGEVLVDQTGQVHALRNTRAETLVTLHLYAPPLPELRRFCARVTGDALLPAFTRARDPRARVVAIVGGGFSGTLAAAHLVRLASAEQRPLHVVIVDRQATFGEGPAYRTADARHLLNVPASNMSAWPDRPADFVAWAQARDARVQSSDFLPRRVYGEYVRARFFETIAEAGERVSVEIVRAEVSRLERAYEGWRVELDGASPLAADAVILATGHRPPDDPLRGRFVGSRARYIEDPWASLALSAIGDDEPIVLLGSGLTALDVLLTVTRGRRSAPVVALSRRGLLPAWHAPDLASVQRVDPSPWLEPLLARPGGPRARELVRGVRAAIADERENWRGVIDGLRPHTARVWSALSPDEASRFLRHVRPFWEVCRHRAAPSIGLLVDRLREEGLFRSMAGRVARAESDDDGVTLHVRPRGSAEPTILRTAWVINCTGPGTTTEPSPVVGSLIEGGHARADRFGLGLLTRADGHPIGAHGSTERLVVIGTLRKPQLWESTAVPELRQQALDAARAVLASI